MSSEKFDIFVSYAHEDKEIVGEVIGKLSSAGLFVWVDKEIHHGESISSRIVKAIEIATFVLFFSSKNSNASDYCIGEILVAVQKKKCIIPIKIDSSDYSDDLLVHLIRLHYVNFIEGFSVEEFDELVSVLSGGVQTKEITIESNRITGTIKKRILLVTIWVVVGICVSIGVVYVIRLQNKGEKEEIIEYEDANGISHLSEDKTEELRKMGTYYSTTGKDEESITIIVPEYEVEYFVNEYKKVGVTVNVHEGNICSCRGNSSLINEIARRVNNEWTGYTIAPKSHK